MKQRWSLAWRFSFRSSGLLLAFLSGVLLFGRLLITLANMELAASTFSSFEVVIPLIAGLHAAVHGPEDAQRFSGVLAGDSIDLTW